jgi:hypothetical protein
MYENKAKAQRGPCNEAMGDCCGVTISRREGKVVVVRPGGFMGGGREREGGCVGVSRLNQ